jgi:hypothetical protein
MREAESAAAPERASDCLLEWMRAAGLWGPADDAVVLVRYGPGALDGHWFCCVAQPWRSSRQAEGGSATGAQRFGKRMSVAEVHRYEVATAKRRHSPGRPLSS